MTSIKGKFSYADALKKKSVVTDYNTSSSETTDSSDTSPALKSTELPDNLNNILKCHDSDFLNPDWKLPGGPRYQKDGHRLEKALFNSLPQSIKNKICVNVKPLNSDGNIIVEFDMIYQSESTKGIISFEIKGVNKHTIDNLERQNKLIKQGLRQRQYLLDNYGDYSVENVYCFVTGKQKKSESSIDTITNNNSEYETDTEQTFLDPVFIKRLISNGFKVAIGETPQQCAKRALFMLKLSK